jgi:heme-degrading monooxygenase HmoA
MYLRPGAESELRSLARRFESEKIPGFVFQHVLRTDADANKYILIVGFTSRDAYVANANSQEQHARYLKLRELLVADPDWHDGEIVFSQTSPIT